VATRPSMNPTEEGALKRVIDAPASAEHEGGIEELERLAALLARIEHYDAKTIDHP